MHAAGRITATGSLAIGMAVLPTAGAQAAPKPPVNNLITAKQFPGFSVSEKPAVLERDEPTGDPCDVVQPTDSVNVGTTLTRTTKVNGRVTRATALSEELVRLRTWQAAHVYFAKARAVLGVPSCTAAEDGVTSTVTVQPAAAPGSDEGFTALATISEGGESLTVRIYVHRAGRDVIIVTPTTVVLTGTGDDATVTIEENAATRNLGRLGVAAALERLNRTT